MTTYERTAADYAEAAERDRRNIRISALSLAHATGECPEFVVERAKAYLAFIESDGE